MAILVGKKRVLERTPHAGFGMSRVTGLTDSGAGLVVDADMPGIDIRSLEAGFRCFGIATLIEQGGNGTSHGYSPSG